MPAVALLIGALRDPRCLDVEVIDHLAASVSEVDRQISSVPFGRLQAEVAARSGRCRDAIAALRLAWLTLGSAGADGDGFTEGRLWGFKGVCELHAGTPQRAHDQLERCLATLNAPRDQVQRGIISTDLTIARLRAGDVRFATTLLHDSENTRR